MKCNNCNYEKCFIFSKVRCFYSKEQLSVVKCSNCGLIYLNPRPDKNLGLAYFEKAYSNAIGFEDNSYYRDKAQIFIRNEIRFKTISNLAVPNHKVLDFGAGQGHFIKTVLDNGWDARGIELSIAAIQAAKMNFGLELLNSTQKLDLNGFGVITLWDVIEHLENPKSTLLELTKYLHPKGYFVIETSNIESLDYLVQKKKWSYWHVDHLYYYSRKTINYLFDTLNFYPITPQSFSDLPKQKTSEIIMKYKALFNPKTLFFALKKRLIAFKFKTFEKNSLMTIIFQRKN